MDGWGRGIGQSVSVLVVIVAVVAAAITGLLSWLFQHVDVSVRWVN